MNKETWMKAQELAEAAEKIVKDEGHKVSDVSIQAAEDGGRIAVIVCVHHKEMLKDGEMPLNRNKVKTVMEEAAWKAGYKLTGCAAHMIPFIIRGLNFKFEFRREAKVEIITPKKTETTWESIAEVIKNGDAKDMFNVGDKVPFRMKDGTEVIAVAAHVTDDRVYFVIDDAVDKYKMYDRIPDNEPISWSGSDMRTYLNGDVMDNMPSALAAVIKKRMITQQIGGKEIVTEDALWLPSYTELFGRGEDGGAYPTDGKDEFHFDLFEDERSRVKQFEGETDWWWTRTPRHADSGSSTFFRSVSYYGYASSANATDTYSVCFGFCIGR